MIGLLLAATLAANPQPSSWSLTFSDDSVAEHFPDFTSHALVVVDPNAAAAVKALRARVRKGRGSDFVGVPDDFARPGLDDATLARSAQRFGAKRIAIARLYAGSSLLVSIYNEEGAPLGSFAATEGVAYAHPGVVDPPIEPSIEGQLSEIVRDEDSLEELKALAVGFNELATFEQGTKIDSQMLPVQGAGKKQRALSWSEFYEVVGREDLAAYTRVREGQQNTLRLIAAGFGIGGLALGIASAVGYVQARSDFNAPDPGFPVGLAIAPVGLLGAAVFAAIANGVQTDSASRLEVRQYAADYNASLLRRRPGSRKKAAAHAPMLQVAFAVGPSGLGLSGAF